MWSTTKHFRIFLVCSAFYFGFTYIRNVVRLHFEVSESTISVEDHFIRDLHYDTIEETPIGTVVKNKAAVSHPNASAKSSSLPFSTLVSESHESNNRSVHDPSVHGLAEAEPQEHHSIEAGMNATEISEFTRQEGVVIVTKIHGPHQLSLFKQSMCLLHQAYNKKVQYNIVLFTTVPIMENETSLMDTRAMISPVKLHVVVDNDGIVNEINKLSPLRRQNFLKRCNVTSPQEITWDSECNEEGVGMGRIGYNWQAEFRSWHIWRHEALHQYRYMLWIDTDAFCTEVWDRDPIAIAMKKRMVIYFDNYPQGRAKLAQPRVKQAFGTNICHARKSSSGSLYSATSDDCSGAQLWTIHGFHHITDLDFYRQKKVIEWAEIMIGDCFLCRKFDDQIAVTVPPIMIAPERAWDMYKSGHQPGIYHNNLIDGKRSRRAGGFLKFWEENGESQFPEAWTKCEITETN